MIGRLHGTLIQKQPPQLLIDVQGVGYEVDVPMSTFYHLPALNEPVTLIIHHAVREDGHFLYGFLSEAERATFRQLLKVSGIGARTALSILSGLSVTDLAEAVIRQEAGRLVRIPGIGKKTAERLLLELKDKLPPPGLSLPAGSMTASTVMPAETDPHHDVRHALLALGYNEREATAALKQLPAGLNTSDGIRQALRLLSPAG